MKESLILSDKERRSMKDNLIVLLLKEILCPQLLRISRKRRLKLKFILVLIRDVCTCGL